MRRVWSHGGEHAYEDRAHHVTYKAPANGWAEWPDEVAAYVVPQHPDHLCDITEETEPDRHQCRLSGSGVKLAAILSQELAAVEVQGANKFPPDMSTSMRRKVRAVNKRTGGRVGFVRNG